VLNPNTAAATVTFTVNDEIGVETGSAAVSITPGGQTARLFSGLFRNVNASGWVQAASSVSGLQGFTMGGDFVNNVDGIASSNAASEQIFSFVGAQ
jgi:hypothetical protein